MRDDQYQRLQSLQTKLTDVLLVEANPDNWSGADTLPKELTQQDRGDRYWCKKNAVATISLAIRIGSLVGMIQRDSAAGAGASTVAAGPPEDDGQGLLDAEIRDAEKEAAAMLDRMGRSTA